MSRFQSNNSILKVRKTNWSLYALILMMVLCFAWLIEKNIILSSSLILGLGIFTLVILFFVGLLKPKIVFFILVGYVPFNRILVGDFGGFMTAVNVTNLLILIIIFGWFIKSYSSGTRLFAKNSLNLPIIFFCLFGCLSLIKGASFFGSDYLNTFVAPLKRWLTPIILYFLAVNLTKTGFLTATFTSFTTSIISEGF